MMRSSKVKDQWGGSCAAPPQSSDDDDKTAPFLHRTQVMAATSNLIDLELF